jgi:2-oxo-4-hydroxy-4-carboxy-5-ureidoimidazoline decarboxylase
MNPVLARWNSLRPEDAAQEILPCCGSKAWADRMADRRPIPGEAALLTACDEVWWSVSESDWLEAFRSHPRIGESAAHSSPARSANWSAAEQRKVAVADIDLRSALAQANRKYEEQFHRIFIVCATNRSAPEILDILQRRLRNDDATELREAAEQQRQIAHLRLKKWLAS